MTQREKDLVDLLTSKIEVVYKQEGDKLLFHGQHIILFVKNKALEFASSLGANQFIVESAALVHDLDNIVSPSSEPEAATPYRYKLLSELGYTQDEVTKIESIIMESHTGTRNNQISDEGKSLSDAGTLFKSLPITPILFTGSYIKENNIDIQKLAAKVTWEQNRLLEEGIYFYTDAAKSKYLKWAETNLALRNNVNDCLQDKDVTDMLKTAQDMGVL